MREVTTAAPRNRPAREAAAAILRAAIVDDSPPDRLNLRTLLAGFPGFDVVAEAPGLDEARKMLRDHAVDLVFLDIELGPQSGFDLLEDLDPRPQVIFTTVHTHYGVQAFDVGAVDYLVKPVNEDRLLRALGRVMLGSAGEQRVTVYRSGGARHLLALETIAGVVGDGDHSRVFCGTREYPDSRRLRDWAELLSRFGFARLDRSTLLRMDQIVSWQPHGAGATVTLRQSSIPFELGRTAFRRLLELAA